jgi:hypothetical protein
MNCRKFETIINDLVRASVMDAGVRVSGLAHADNCARCASRLADERALTLGLRAMSAGAATTTREAPARVEAALLAAFRGGAGASTLASGTAPAAAAVVLQMPQRMNRRWSWQTGAAVAAALLLAVTLSLVRLRPQPEHSQSQLYPTQLAQQSGADSASQTTQTSVKAGDSQRGVSVAQSEVTPLDRKTTRGRRQAASYQAASYRVASLNRGARRSEGVVNPNDATRVVNAGSGAGETEIATDFMPLTYDGGAMAMESGHVVRVELPRSALLSMGLPMNQERAGELIKADVLMGDDGVARAIRFVR